jgi:hypothetical protein
MEKPDAATLDAIRRDMAEAFVAYAKGKEMLLPSTVFLVTAQRPR